MLHRLVPAALIILLLTLPGAIRAQTPVPATANPWLAGMPSGSSVGTDSAPGQSPVRFDQIDLADVDSIQFAVTGAVDFLPGCAIPPNAGCAPNGPDGENAADGTRTALPGNGISNLHAPLNALIGVFLTDERPDLSAAPADLDFRDTGLTRDFQSLSPALKQAFFIGDGLTSGGVRQTFFVPPGATRLFLGTLDSAGWSDNSGQLQVQVACDLGSPDRDCDGIDDAFDLCPDWAWSAEVDTDVNGIGNQCECGDQNGDGRVNVIDLVAINTAIFNPGQVTPLCDTNEDGLCNVVDIVGANLKIFGAPAWCSRYPEPDIVLSIVDSDAVGVGRPADLRVTLTDPAPAGGITVSVTSDDPDSLEVAAPGSVSIPAGETQATIALEGFEVGTIPLRAEAPGLRGAALPVRVTLDFITLGAGLSVAPGNTVSLPVSISQPAPPGGVTIALSSNDPTKATVAPTVFIPAGLQVPAANPQVTGVGFGIARISASAPGYASATVDVAIALSLSFSPATRTIPVGTSSDLTLLLSGPAPAAGLTINLSSDNPLVASAPASVFVAAGQTSAPVPVNGVALGNTTLRASAPGISETTASVTVSAAPAISVATRIIGDDLEESGSASLGAPAPAGNLEVTITSTDPTRLLLATSASAAGSASITRTVGAGTTAIPAFFVQALDGSGSVNVVATAPGYADGVASMTLTPSGFIITFPASISTTPLSANTSLQILAARLNPTTLAFASGQQLRGGLSVSVPVTSSDTSVGVITTSPVVFNGADQQASTQFDPQAAGTTTLALGTPPGFDTPSNFQSITATVTGAGITLGARTVGDDLEEATSGSLGAPAPAGGVTVTLTSADPTRLLLATDATTPGSASITRTVNAGQTAIGTFFVQALEGTGSVNVVATAPGYADGVAAMTLAPSGFIINLPASISTTSFSANTNLLITPARLNPTTLAFAQNQQLRAGFSANVAVTSSDTAVGVITTSPVVFNGGASSATTQFDPAGAGTSTLSVAPPAGFDTPSTLRSITATVTAPQVRVNNGNAVTVGLDLQDSIAITLEAAPPSPVDVTVTSSSGAIATLSTSGTLAGGTSVTFTNVTTTSVGTVFVQGRSQASATLTGTAAGYSDGTASVTVQPSGFIINSPSSITTTTFAANSNLNITSARLNPTTLAFAQNQPVRGGLSVNVPVASSDPSVGVITVSPLLFNGNVGLVSSQFDPLAAGVSTLTVGPAPGFSTPSNLQSITATVTAPQVRVNNGAAVTVGLDLQDSISISLQSAPPSPVDVTVTSSSGAIATLSTSGTLVGGNSVTFTNVTTASVGTVFVQGRSLGSATLTGTAAGYSDGTASVTVQPSGFIINSPGSITTTAAAGNTNVQIAAARLNPTTLNFVQSQPLRGGLSVNVSVTSSNPAVGAITISPLVFNGNVQQLSTQFDPIAAGSSTLEVVPPAGFSSPSNFRSITATVNP